MKCTNTNIILNDIAPLTQFKMHKNNITHIPNMNCTNMIKLFLLPKKEVSHL